MKKIWLKKYTTPSWNIEYRAMQFLAIGIMILSFCGFTLYHQITNRIFTPNKIDIFNDLDQISLYFWLIDPELSQQIKTLNQLITAYLKGENVLKTREAEILQLRSYAREKKSYLKKVGFSNYEKAFDMLDHARALRSEIFQLLGKDQTFNYLIPLQNSNEARPNGGFFGSFAFVSLSGGHIVDLQIIDSYLPDYIAPNTRVQLPTRLQRIGGGHEIGFIAGNKFWFTDKDGKNLKTLYEKIFHTDFLPERKAHLFNAEQWNKLFEKNIKGVIFLDSELISELLPSFRNKAREWQFINANIDIIRGENRSNKKELYIQDLQKYLKNNSLKLASSTLNNLQTLLHKGYINIYLSNISGAMRDFLDQRDLTTVYHPEFLYFWHTNTSYNKADAFLKKQVEILNTSGEVLLSTQERKLNISSLTPWDYRINITYTFDVPKTYIDQMIHLESTYQITMTDREKYILALQDHNLDPTIPHQRRSSKEYIHLPKTRKIKEITGDITQPIIFDTDFSQGVSYQNTILTSPSMITSSISVNIPETNP